MRLLSLSRVVSFALVFATAPSFAAQLGAEREPFSLEVHAFVSQGFLISTDNNFLAKSSEGSFEFTEVGINFTMPLAERLRVGLQLFSRKLGPASNLTTQMDWFYLDYHWADWLGFRAGRVKLPFGLYNDTSDIDAARTSILLPQSIYPATNRNFLLAQTGGEIYGYLHLRGAGALEYRLYGGTIQLDSSTPAGSPFAVQELTVPFLAGGRLLWETPVEGLRIGGSFQDLRLDATLFSNSAGSAHIKLPAVLTVGSLEYLRHELLLAAEYSRWYTSVETDNPAVFPASNTTTSERAYALAAYRFRQWLQGSFYYSLLYPNVDRRSGRANMQHDLATTIRFDINEYWLVKLEGHYMQGTAALTSALNDNRLLGQLERDWALFLIKTTAYF